MVTRERLMDLLVYSPTEGRFRWRNSRGPQTAGSFAGCIHAVNQYRYLTLDGVAHREHRLIWLYMTGDWPKNTIDHVNGDKQDNRWDNLREATDSQNKANKGLGKKNKSGFKGVSWVKQKQKWGAFITIDNKVRNLGSYDTKEEAHEAYRKAASVAFGEFARYA